MRQPLFLALSGLAIHRSYLLKLGVEIYSYNDHVRLLSPEPVGWFWHHQLTRAWEPTLSWNQLHSLTKPSVVFFQHDKSVLLMLSASIETQNSSTRQGTRLDVRWAHSLSVASPHSSRIGRTQLLGSSEELPRHPQQRIEPGLM
jgi:hypothetical protein